MDDVPAPEAAQPATELRTPGRPEDPGASVGALAWPSPPPETVEHAVALLAATWTRARGAA